MKRLSRRPPLILLLLGSLAWTACTSKQGESPVQTPKRVVSESMGIAIADLPADFEVVSNQGSVLELRTVGDAAGGTLVVEVTEELAGGINLVAAAEAMQEWFEQQPDGEYFGNLELGTPTGPAFTSRGSYRSDQGEVEELRVFALHPSENRMVRMTFSYPPGEGKIRMQQLVSVLGEIEGR